MEFNATFIVSIISFLMFVWIMNTIFYAPISKIVFEREEKLKKNYDDAEQLNSEANSILKYRDEKLSQTDSEARHIISDKIEDYNSRSKNALTQSSQQAAEEIKKRRNELKQVQSDAENELSLKTQYLAELITAKVMGIDVETALTNNSGEAN